MRNRPRIPELVKRKLRKESNFGCAICGNPLITYHHIIPLEEKIHNNPKYMISLCANCHQLADNKTIKQEKLYERKKNPFNKEKTTDKLKFESRMPGVILGSVMILLIRNLINFDGKVVLAMNILPSGFLQLDVELYDIDNNLIASVKNNEWIVYVDDIWDMIYRGKYLKIWNEKRKIGFELEYNPSNELIFINGRFCYNGRSVRIDKENGIISEQTNNVLHNFSVVGPGQNIKIEGGTIFNITFPAKNLLFIPINNEPPENTVFPLPKTKYSCIIDKNTNKIHLASCRFITSHIELDYSKKKEYPDGIIAIPNKPRPSNFLDYELISKAEQDGYVKCKICF